MSVGILALLFTWQAIAVKGKTLAYIRHVCCAQTMDRDNPWIALPKVWIRALRNNPWIVCSIHGSRKRGTQSTDLGQTILAWTLARSGGLCINETSATFATEATPAAIMMPLKLIA